MKYAMLSIAVAVALFGSFLLGVKFGRQVTLGAAVVNDHQPAHLDQTTYEYSYSDATEEVKGDAQDEDTVIRY